jgi:hypothetical protein
MAAGDKAAAFRLLQRGRALKSIASGDGYWPHIAAMNQARAAKRRQSLLVAAVAAERERLKLKYRLIDNILYELQARYGGWTRYYAENECRPVAPIPGERCPVCGWAYGGSPEFHIIGVPVDGSFNRAQRSRA